MLDTARDAPGQLLGKLSRSSAPWRLINALLLVALVTAGIVAYFAVGRQGSSTAGTRLTTGTVQRGSVLSTVSASGNVQPAQTLSLSFAGTGTIQAIYVQPGARVRPGQPLAKLDDTSETAAVRTARANLVSAQANLTSLEAPLTPATQRQNDVAVSQANTAIATEQAALRSAVASTSQDQQTLQKAVRDAVASANQDRQTLQKAVRDAVATASQDRQTLQKAVDQARQALKQAQQGASASSTSLRTSVGEAKGAWLEAKAAAANDLANLQSAIDQANAQLQRDQAELASDQANANTYTSEVASATSTANGLQGKVDDDKANVQADQQKQHDDECDLPSPPQPKCANDAFRLSQDQSQLSNDQSALSTAQSNLNSLQSKLDAATSAVSADQTKIVADQTQVTNAQNALASGQLKDAQSVNQAYRAWVNAQSSHKAGLVSNAQSIQNAQNAVKTATQSLNAGVLKDQQTIQNARQSLKAGVLKDQQAIQNARQSLKAGVVKDGQSVESARASVTNAKQSLESTIAANAAKAAPATGGQLAGARAQIVSAQTALENALSAEKQMTLVSPAAGTVAAVNGAVGETPGAGSSSSSSTGFITLVNLDRPEVLANFSEADAAKIRAGQPATVTVDALPGQELAAHVVSVATTQTVVSNVVTYAVTLVLDRTVAGLKPGMTVSAQVIVAKRDGVLHVPNAAVHTTSGSSYVTLVGAKGRQTEQPVQPGLVGDDSTEIVGGLKAGQQVVVSTLSTLTTTTGIGGGRGVGAFLRGIGGG